MRIPSDMPDPPRRKRRDRSGKPPLPNRGRIVAAVIAVLLVILVLSLRAIATFWTDILWFDTLGLTTVWKRLLSAKVTLAAATTVVFFLLLWGNLVIADKLAPRFMSLAGPEDDVRARYKELLAGRQRLAWVVLSFLIALVPGLSAAAQWQNWILFRYGGNFGVKDPQFKTDIGFFVFKLPFLSTVVDWMFGFLLVTVLIVGVVHYLNGAIRVYPLGERITPNAKTHLSVLLALAAFVKAGDYWLQRYELVNSGGGSFAGAGYADVNAALPAIQLMILISAFAGVMLIANIRRKGWAIPLIILGLWGLIAIVAGSVYPAFVQRFQVSPAELAKEKPYIERNIQATRAALNLGEVKGTDFNYSPNLSDADVEEGSANLDNARLLDPTVVLPTIQDLQVEREYYRFTDVDVDRYDVGGERTPVVISARELNLGGVTNPSWEKLHLVFTHGYAAALAPANEVNSRGEPKFLMKGIPVESTQLPRLDQPEIYVGESMAGYAMVGTKQTELSSDNVQAQYRGKAGVSAGSTVRRAAFALRFGEIEPLISGSITKDSKVIYIRDVVDRVSQVAPFLQFDPDPYPVLIDGRVKYIVDAYTTTTKYPYGEMVDAAKVTSGELGSFNYIRNSAKAVVDSYDGKVTFYLSDDLYGGEKDPIIRAYAKAFPGLFKSEIPDDVMAHLRYPEFMFKAQTSMWGRYHQTDPSTFFNNSDRWVIAPQPPDSGAGTITPDEGSAASTATQEPMEPYYQELRIGAAESTQFVLTRPFVLSSGDGVGRNLTSVMIARMDPEHYGKLEQIVMVSKKKEKVSRNNSVDGPVQANRKMATYVPVTEFQTLTGQRGSTIRYGNILILPMGDALLYLRPVYVAQERSSRFTLKKVIMLSGDAVGFGDTVERALADLRDSDPDGAVDAPSEPIPETETSPDSPDSPDTPETPETPETPDTPATGTPEQLIAQADAKFTAADQRLKAGDPVGYAQLVEEARGLVAQAAKTLVAQQDESSTTTTTTSPPTGG